MSELPEFPFGTLWFATGSRVICDPPPTGTDYDVVVLEALEADPIDLTGWTRTTPECSEYPPRFVSWRKGEVNLIVTRDPDLYDKFVVATRLAKRFNLLKKEDRIALFRGVLYGV